MNRLERAELELKEFLEENPHMRFFQARIEKALQELPNSDARLQFLVVLIQDRLQILMECIQSLDKIKKNT